MEAMQFIVKQAEGLCPLPGPRTYTDWEAAAHHLRTICRSHEGGMGYLKTDVTIVFADGSWERRRFDAEMDELGTPRDLEFFRRNTLLWSTRKSHPEVGCDE